MGMSSRSDAYSFLLPSATAASSDGRAKARKRQAKIEEIWKMQVEIFLINAAKGMKF